MKKAILGIVLFLTISTVTNAQTYHPNVPDEEVIQTLEQWSQEEELKLRFELVDESDTTEIVAVEGRVPSTGLRDDLRQAIYGYIRVQGYIYKGLYNIWVMAETRGGFGW